MAIGQAPVAVAVPPRVAGLGTTSAAHARRLPRLALATVALTALLRVVYGAPAVGYDAWSALAWGREVAHGALPDLTGSWAPTPHPLAIALCAPLSLLGDAAPDVLGLLSLLALAAVAVTAATLAARLFGPVAAVVAAVVLLTRPLLVGAALQGSTDLPFLAFVLGAGAALAARRDRRALVLLTAAGLLRPEAWPLALALALWTRRPLAPALALALAAPLSWMAFDLACTGDPLHSLHGTQDLADGLHRPQGLITALGLLPDYLTVVLGDGVALLGGAAAIAAVWVAPRRAALPLAILAAGLVGFLALGATGLPLLYRYTLLPAAALVLLGAWGTQEALARRRALPIAIVALGVLTAAVVGARAEIVDHVHYAHRNRVEQRDLTALLHTVAASTRACGDVAVTYHRPAPQIAFVTGRPARRDRGVLLVPRTGTLAFADRLAPSDAPPRPGRGALMAVHGAWTALATC